MKIKVKRISDGKVFTNDMNNNDCICEIHFCTSYTQVIVQELNGDGLFITSDIILDPLGTTPNPIDLIATQNDEIGCFEEQS